MPLLEAVVLVPNVFSSRRFGTFTMGFYPFGLAAAEAEVLVVVNCDAARFNFSCPDPVVVVSFI